MHSTMPVYSYMILYFSVKMTDSKNNLANRLESKIAHCTPAGGELEIGSAEELEVRGDVRAVGRRAHAAPARPVGAALPLIDHR